MPYTYTTAPDEVEGRDDYVISFDGTKTAFGRHETFPLRFGWLTKGYRAWCDGDAPFAADEATVVLGVGKNMVAAIRYWLVATQVATSLGPTLASTEIGSRIFSRMFGQDPYLEDDTTLWLLHWLIASNPHDATSFYWFFNRYHKPEFSSAELFTALKEFAGEMARSSPSDATLRHDANVLLRSYVGSAVDGKRTPIEEALDSPLSVLGLVSRSGDGRHLISRPSNRRNLPVASLAYSVLDFLEARNGTSIPVQELLHADGPFACPGTVFRLSDDGLVTKLEEMIRWLPGCFDLRETAGIHQFYVLKHLSKSDVLAKHYGHAEVELVA
jgi:hypothetical protein